MTPTLRIHTLGGLEITLGDEPLPALASRKAVALLVYLAVTRRPHTRLHLADLLWDDLPSRRALGNLSVLLSSLRKHLPGFVQANRQYVALHPAPESALWVDAAALDARLPEKGYRGPNAALPGRDEATRLEEALRLYRGDFLADFAIRKGRGFEEWAALERERLRRKVFEALAALVQFYTQAGEYAAGLQHARRLLALDPFREETYRQMMLLLARSGQRQQALRQFLACRDMLQREMGLEPSPATLALYQRIRETATAPLRLPPQPTPFVGRSDELAQLSAYLADPNRRLITLLGPGGIGKTRLSLQAAAENRHLFLNGVVYLSLADLSSAELLPAAIAEGLGLSLFGNESPQTQILRYLQTRELLLVLDNFEHLLSARGLVETLLQGAPGLKIMIASRQRLNVPSEWLFTVEGMSRHATTGESDAVRLFASVARRVQPDFALTAENLPAVERICHLVDGSPLGIELAASWVRMLSPEEIAAEIARELDFLESDQHAARHRSLRAVFDYSWETLTSEEQGAFSRLAVFQGGFTREAALEVADASLRLLSALSDKSLLHRTGNRYHMHKLLQQYALEKLAAFPPEHTRTFSRHRRFYIAFLQAQEARLHGEGQAETLSAIAAEIENIRAAWQQALEAGEYESLLAALDGLFAFYEMRSWFHEGEAAFRAAAHISAAGPAALLSPEGQRLRGRALVRQGWFLIRLGKHKQGWEQTKAGADILRALEDEQGLAFALVTLAHAAYYIGSSGAALQACQESLTLARRLGDQRGEARALNTLGVIYREQGDYEAAREALDKSLRLYRQSGDAWRMALVLNNLGVVARIQGRYAEARQHYRESLAVKRRIGDRHGEAVSLNNLGNIAFELGEAEEARRLHRESLGICEQIGDRQGMARSLHNLGDLAFEEGAYQEAGALYRESLRIKEAIGDQRGAIYSLNRLGETAVLLGDLAG
ncbi:MAG: tetratricopeptide repeat protein, partial [Chloroflexi bacterium]|nr:tetratricopeptide repeat protein [Chloroflexota bacterium]